MEMNFNDNTMDDAMFKQHSQLMQKEAKEKKEKAENAGNYQDYVDEKEYVDFPQGQFKVIRLLGVPIGAEKLGVKRSPIDPHEFIYMEVKDDKGKKFKIRLPLPATSKDEAINNHILKRMYDKVCEYTIVNKEKVYPNKARHPELYEAMTKGGYKPTDGKSYTWSSGYKGTRMVVFNVLDRQDNWCTLNKHTKLIARDISYGQPNDKGETPRYVNMGVKSFGFNSDIDVLTGKHGSYMNYDVAIMRTGIQDNPFIIENASRCVEKEIMEDLTNQDGTQVDAAIIKLGPLTAEEKSFEAYNIEEVIRPTPYHKLKERIPSLFKLCDACLGTNFEEELNGLVEKEKKEIEAWKAAHDAEAEAKQAAAETAAIQEKLEEQGITEEDVNAAVNQGFDALDPLSMPVSDPVATPTVARRSAAPAQNIASKTISDAEIALLKGWTNLTDQNRAQIVSAVDKGSYIEINYTPDAQDLLVCDCNAQSPSDFKFCPACGCKFPEA